MEAELAELTAKIAGEVCEEEKDFAEWYWGKYQSREKAIKRSRELVRMSRAESVMKYG